MQQAAALVADSTIQIAGATGGVGSRAVQRAAAAGALVVATAHTDEDKACVAAFGAAETVSYSTTPAAVLARHPEGVDVVIHLAGDAAALLPAMRAQEDAWSLLLAGPGQPSGWDRSGRPCLCQLGNRDTGRARRQPADRSNGSEHPVHLSARRSPRHPR